LDAASVLPLLGERAGVREDHNHSQEFVLTTTLT
jgi:hypothetical protein